MGHRSKLLFRSPLGFSLAIVKFVRWYFSAFCRLDALLLWLHPEDGSRRWPALRSGIGYEVPAAGALPKCSPFAAAGLKALKRSGDTANSDQGSQSDLTSRVGAEHERAHKNSDLYDSKGDLKYCTILSSPFVLPGYLKRQITKFAEKEKAAILAELGRVHEWGQVLERDAMAGVRGIIEQKKDSVLQRYGLAKLRRPYSGRSPPVFSVVSRTASTWKS